MDRLVHNFLGPVQLRAAGPARGFPPLNVWEDGENIYVEAEVPGLKSDDIEITVVGDDLTIRGRRGGEVREGQTYHRQERGVGEFNRVLRLPVEVDGDKVEATLNDGILLIKLPRAEAAKPKKIKVTPGQ
jgi:HSP20 family protein